MSCDTSTENGHDWCTIYGDTFDNDFPGKRTLECYTNTSTVKIISLTKYYTVCLGGLTCNGVVDTKTFNIQNKKISFPPTSSFNDITFLEGQTPTASGIDNSCSSTIQQSNWTQLQSDEKSFVPVRINTSGNIECMSTDGTNCLWKETDTEVNDLITTKPSIIKPIQCSNDKYLTPDSWCYMGMKQVNPGSPKLPNLKLKSNTVITAIGLYVVKDTPKLNYSVGDIVRIPHIFYCSLDNLFKISKWRVGDKNGDNPIKSLSVYQVDDMEVIGSNAIDSNSLNYCFINPTKDYGQGYALTDAYYTTLNIGASPANGVCFAFRNVLDVNSSKVYYWIVNGIMSNGTSFPSGSWIKHTESQKGDFISQLSMVYSNIDDPNPTEEEGNPIATVIKGAINELGQIRLDSSSNHGGFKGFSSVKIVRFDPNDENSFYNYKIDDVKCCNLLSDEQYGENTFEASYCQNVKNQVVINGIPISTPNFQCKAVLSDYCSKKDKDGIPNIKSEMCGMYCAQDDTNCDDAIKGYCNSDKFYIKYPGPPETKVLSLQKLYDDEVCGCTFAPTATDMFKSYPLTVQKTLQQRLTNPGDISPNLRLECTLPQCKQGNYKLFDQKLALKNKACTTTESCIGDGFIIPAINDDKSGSSVSCEIYSNTKKCIDPPKGVMGIVPNPWSSSCKNVLKGTTLGLPMGPDYCVLGKGEKVGGCIPKPGSTTIGTQKFKRPIVIPGIPSGDPSMCPKPTEYPAMEYTESCIIPPPPKPVDDSKSKLYMIIGGIVFLLIYFIFIFMYLL